MKPDRLPINRYLDHAVLKPEMTRDEARDAILLGVHYDVRTVCVRPCDIELALELCDGTTTDVGTVLSFPHGAGHPKAKSAEAKVYIDLGVREIDMVVNYGRVRSGCWDEVRHDISSVSAVTRPAGILLKVIFETSELDLSQISRTTDVAIECGADFVKTSTGFTATGATMAAVEAMIAAAAGRISVKASGGIRDLAAAESFLDLGCARLGVGYSSVATICSGAAGGVAGTNPGDAY